MYLLVFFGLLLIPLRFFVLNPYFLTMNIADSLSTYRIREERVRRVDSFLAIFFIVGMGALAALAT